MFTVAVALFILGVAFLINTTVFFDNSDPLNGRIGIVSQDDNDGDCSDVDYSENGLTLPMKAYGGTANFAAGVYTSEIELGGQSFEVQLDTGSGQLL